MPAESPHRKSRRESERTLHTIAVSIQTDERDCGIEVAALLEMAALPGLFTPFGRSSVAGRTIAPRIAEAARVLAALVSRGSCVLPLR